MYVHKKQRMAAGSARRGVLRGEGMAQSQITMQELHDHEGYSCPCLKLEYIHQPSWKGLCGCASQSTVSAGNGGNDSDKLMAA